MSEKSLEPVRTESDQSAIAEDEIRGVVLERAHNDSKDSVSDLRSDANMEQTLQREYFGRFLIELLQNARDAWRKSNPENPDGVLRIHLGGETPALTVCNQGQPLDASVVLYSIGKFGESTKRQGEGIGYKGIGFKSVLEVTHCPEIYSRADGQSEFDLRVRFDPGKAHELIREHSPNWETLESDLPSSNVEARSNGNLYSTVPILKFPLWIKDIEPHVARLAALEGTAFNTMIRLPFSASASLGTGANQEDWLATIRCAIGELSDEMLMLMGVFATVDIEDELLDFHLLLERENGVERKLRNGGKVREVSILRNGKLSTSWLLYERTLPGFDGIEGDIVIGVRVEKANDSLKVVSPSAEDAHDSPSRFHLFFPTEIQSHLPFLLQAYFEVDASRKGFAADRTEHNETLLDGLCQLSIDVTEDLVSAESGQVDASSLPDLFGLAVGDPDDKLANRFRTKVLNNLDEVAWVFTHQAEQLGDCVAPKALLVETAEQLAQLVPRAFPPSYLRESAGLSYPDPQIGKGGRLFLAQRAAGARGEEAAGVTAERLEKLLRPEKQEIWPSNPDDGFRALLGTLQFLEDIDQQGILAITEDLRGDPAARLIPVLSEDVSKRAILPVPAAYDPQTRTKGAAIFARLKSGVVELPVPPPALGVAFLKEGLISDQLLTVAGQLEIREFSTAAVLDRLGQADVGSSEAARLLEFLWRTLLSDTRSGYALAEQLDRYTSPSYGHWFWFSEEADDRRRRSQALAEVPVPTRSGKWKPAGEVAFGSDWGDWLKLRSKRLIGELNRDRANAYSDLETLAPDPDSLLAAPDDLLRLLPCGADDTVWLVDEEKIAVQGDSLEQHDRHHLLIHLFLLTLGVWEIPPLSAISNRRDRSKDDWDPWDSLPGRSEYHADIRKDEGWHFNTEYEHENVRVGKDVRLLWTLTGDADAMIRAFERGADFYSRHQQALLFCNKCRTHKTRYDTRFAKPVRSFFNWELQTVPWVPVTRDGQLSDPVKPEDAWWVLNPPSGSRIRQSPLRYLPLVHDVFPKRLVEIVGVNDLEEPDVEHVRKALEQLHTGFHERTLVPDPEASSGNRQAFIGIHRRLYGLLDNAAEDDVQEWARDRGVLTERDRKLSYIEPNSARHDNGRFVAHKRHFLGLVDFVVLSKDAEHVAKVLGVPRFEVQLKRKPSNVETDVTDEVIHFITDRLAEIMALTVHYRISGDTIELGSEPFQERARRLRSLRVVQSDDLVLSATVGGLGICETIGEGADQDVFLDGAKTTSPVLYHDFSGENWTEKLRRHLAPHLAALLDNPAYTDVFALLLQQDEPSELESFLLDKGISTDDLERTRDALDIAETASQQQELIWWNAVLALLGIESELHPESSVHDQLEQIFQKQNVAIGPGELGGILLSAGGGDRARSDTSASGALCALEAAGYDLRTLHEILTSACDSGLHIESGSVQLRNWGAKLGRRVALLLNISGWNAGRAKKASRYWQLDDSLSFKTDLRLVDVLEPVIADLQTAGYEVDAIRLETDDAADYLVSLSGLDEKTFDSKLRGLYDVEERARLQRTIIARARESIVPLLTAIRTEPSDPDFRIVRAQKKIIEHLPATLESFDDLLRITRGLLDETPEIIDVFERSFSEVNDLEPLNTDKLRTRIIPLLSEPGHIERVVKALQRDREPRIRALKKCMAQFDAGQLQMTPYSGSRPKSKRKSKQKIRKEIRSRHLKRDQRKLEDLGEAAERLALATIANALLKAPPDEFISIIESLIQALTEWFEGEAVDNLVAHGRAALAEDADDTERLDAISRFVHLSRESDEFGCDMLGYLSAYPGATAGPLFLEIKSDRDRSVQVSTNEWRCAERLGSDYAFLVVIRNGKSGDPQSMEILPNPARLLEEEKISRNADGWVVGYQLANDAN